jgi:hypothetical protein
MMGLEADEENQECCDVLATTGHRKKSSVFLRASLTLSRRQRLESLFSSRVAAHPWHQLRGVGRISGSLALSQSSVHAQTR